MDEGVECSEEVEEEGEGAAPRTGEESAMSDEAVRLVKPNEKARAWPPPRDGIAEEPRGDGEEGEASRLR